MSKKRLRAHRPGIPFQGARVNIPAKAGPTPQCRAGVPHPESGQGQSRAAVAWTKEIGHGPLDGNGSSCRLRTDRSFVHALWPTIGESLPRAARVQMNADKLLYLYEIDQIIPVQLIPIERGLI